MRKTKQGSSSLILGNPSIEIPIGYGGVMSDALSSSTNPRSYEIAVRGSYRAAILQIYPGAPTTVGIQRHVPLCITAEEDYSGGWTLKVENCPPGCLERTLYPRLPFLARLMYCCSNEENRMPLNW